MKQYLKRNWAAIARLIVTVVLCWYIIGGDFIVIAVCIFLFSVGSECDIITSRYQKKKIDLLEERIELLLTKVNLVRMSNEGYGKKF